MVDPGLARELLRQVRERWAEGRVSFSRHALDRMRERGVMMPEVDELVRRSGRITGCSHPGPGWRATIEGYARDRRLLRCVVELQGKVIVVTVVVLPPWRPRLTR